MPIIKSEYACPICEKQTGAHNQILGNAGRLECSANSQHFWLDHMEFINQNPKMVFKPEVQTNLPQQNHTPYQVSIPISVKDQLEAKFGQEKLRATLASLLIQMVEGEILIVGQTDLERLENGERGLGKRPESSGELVGLIFSLRQEVGDAKMIAATAADEVKAYEGVNVGSVVINLGDLYEKAKEKARAQEPPLPLKMFVERSLRTVLENDWI